jgi:hypothetical protein
MYQGKRSVTQDGWKIQIESMKWGLKSKVSERSRTENCSRSFDRKSSRIGLPFDYGDSVRELFVHGCLPYKLELTTFLYVNQNPVTDFIVGLPTLLLLDNNICSSRINLRTQNYHFTCKTGFFGRNKVVDWHISHFFQNFLTKNKVVDSNSINLLQISKKNES